MRRRTVLRAAIAATAAAAIVAAIVVPSAVTSGVSTKARHGDPLAMLQEPVALLSGPVPTLQTLRSLGVDVVRLQITWNVIAPDPTSPTPPAGFNASDPSAYPAAHWKPYDAVVRDASADGLELNF